MVAIDDSASMLCARVMRGISSIENSVAPDLRERRGSPSARPADRRSR